MFLLLLHDRDFGRVAWIRGLLTSRLWCLVNEEQSCSVGDGHSVGARVTNTVGTHGYSAAGRFGCQAALVAFVPAASNGPAGGDGNDLCFVSDGIIAGVFRPNEVVSCQARGTVGSCWLEFRESECGNSRRQQRCLVRKKEAPSCDEASG